MPRPEEVGKGIDSPQEARINKVVREFQEREGDWAGKNIIFCLNTIRKIAKFKFGQDCDFIGLVLHEQEVHPLIRMEEGGVLVAGGESFQEFFPVDIYDSCSADRREITAVSTSWRWKGPIRYERGHLALCHNELVIYQKAVTDGKKCGVVIADEGEAKRPKEFIESLCTDSEYPAIMIGLLRAAGSSFSD